MALDPRRVKALFNAALDLPDPADRPAFLDRECGDDRELRLRLDELLAAHDGPVESLEPTLADGPGPTGDFAERTQGSRPEIPPPATLIGSVIAGRYRLREEIGEGGMGSVYLAEQTRPVRRKVALKLIKAGMDSRTVLARFESERQALAMMDHPHIAKVLDAGATDAGRPFFVMELVKGIPLTDYCDGHRLGLPERLTLFRQICSAVQHAHQKGIIHRDLKPTNILVESHDGHPVPKVIDFGLAKATSGQPLGDQSLYTAFGTVAGTPLYMAPEQAAFNALDVDTRADIYALGVILYELLTGSTPIRRDTIRRAGLEEMLRVIREVEPPTPSSRISTSEGLAGIAATRHIEPSRLSRFVRGDLDWIVMKALAKERHRRYESAIGLANDVERFTNHEPVSAGPPTAGYRLRKFARRNRPQVVAASLVLLALVGGIVGTSLGLVEAGRQEREAKRHEREAERRLAKLAKANEILGSIFKDLDPRKAEKEGKPLAALLGERLDQATAQVEGEAIGDPLTVARMQLTLGESQRGLGYPEKAIGLLTKARATYTAQLGPDHPDTLNSMNTLALVYQAAGKLDRALPLLEETLALGKSKLRPDDPRLFTIVANLALAYEAAGKPDRALPLLEETLALEKLKLGPDHPSTLTSMHNLANCYFAAGKPDRGLPLHEEALAMRRSRLGADHPDTLRSMIDLATAYMRSGKFDRAVPLSEEALALSKSKLGPDHPDTLNSMNTVAMAFGDAGKPDRALPLYEETLALTRSKLGPDHPDTLTVMTNLAESYHDAGKLDKSIPLLEEALKLRTAKSGNDHPDTLYTKAILGANYKDAGRLGEALPLLEEAYRSGRHIPGHKLVAPLLDAFAQAGQSDKAVALARKELEQIRASLPADSPQRAGELATIGTSLLKLKAWAEAESVVREALAIRDAKEPDAWRTFNTKSLLGGALLGQKKYAEAEPLLRSGYEGMKVRADKIPSQGKVRLVEALDRLIELAEATNSPDDVKIWQDEKAKWPPVLAPKTGPKTL